MNKFCIEFALLDVLPKSGNLIDVTMKTSSEKADAAMNIMLLQGHFPSCCTHPNRKNGVVPIKWSHGFYENLGLKLPHNVHYLIDHKKQLKKNVIFKFA